MTKTKWLNRRTGPSGPYLALCLSNDEFKAAVAHLKSADVPRWVSHGAHATTHTFDNPDGVTTCIVCVSEWKGRKPVEVAGLLVHEAVHVWQRHCEGIGEKRPGDEQEAYAVQFIAQELMTEFARRQV